MRRVTVSVTTKSSRRGIEWISDDQAKVWVHAAPEKGRANRQVCEVIAEDLGVRPSRVHIVSGTTSSKKIVDVDAP